MAEALTLTTESEVCAPPLVWSSAEWVAYFRANDIEVRLASVDQRPDPEIAREAVSALKNELPYSASQIKVVVSNGWITLEGDV